MTTKLMSLFDELAIVASHSWRRRRCSRATHVARDQSTSYVVLYTEFSERFPTSFLSHHMRCEERKGLCTYVLDGLTSSIFLWKGCCVGVAAETETVDELCVSSK